MHPLEDVSAFHAGVIARARTLIRLAAAGVVHLADRDERLRALLGGELHRLMTADAAGLDVGARELFGISMRRAALRDHAKPPHPRRLRSAGLPCRALRRQTIDTLIGG